MKKIVLSCLALFALGLVETTAQNIFYGGGFFAGTAHTIPKTLSGSSGPRQQASQRSIIYGAGISIDAQVIPVGDEMTVGFHAEPGLGYTIPVISDMEDVAVIFQTPLIAQFNYGNFSSIDAQSRFGVGVGVGMLTQYHLLLESSEPIAQGKSLLFLPAAQLSLRFWSPKNNLYVVKLSHAIGNENFGGMSNNRGSTLLGVSRIFNY